MEKILKRVGNSHVILIDKQDREILGIEAGDVLEVSISLKEKRSK